MLRKLIKKRRTNSLLVTAYENLYFCVENFYLIQEDCRQYKDTSILKVDSDRTEYY